MFSLISIFTNTLRTCGFQHPVKNYDLSTSKQTIAKEEFYTRPETQNGRG